MPDQTPSVGRIVQYVLNEGDVAAIDTLFPQTFSGPTARNPVHVGQELPAMVVAVFDPSTTTANLKVSLDGYGSYWATSRTEGDEPGHWHWPTRV